MRVPLEVLPLWRLIAGTIGAVVAERWWAVGRVQPGGWKCAGDCSRFWYNRLRFLLGECR